MHSTLESVGVFDRQAGHPTRGAGLAFSCTLRRSVRSRQSRISARIALVIIRCSKELHRAGMARPSMKWLDCRRYLAAHIRRKSVAGARYLSEAGCARRPVPGRGQVFAVNMLSLVRVQRGDGCRAGLWRRRNILRCSATWYPCAGKLAGRQPLAKSGWLLLPYCARRCNQARLGAALRVSQFTRRLPSPRGSRMPN